MRKASHCWQGRLAQGTTHVEEQRRKLDRKRAETKQEGEYLGLIDRDIATNPDRIRPIPRTMFSRFESIKARMGAILEAEAKEM